jgi:osmotically-inducible protein OsmY
MHADLQLREDVESRLDGDPRLDSRQIGVSAKDGTVVLHGRVASYAGRCAAQESALAVVGVQALANELRIQAPIRASCSDTQIAEAALEALRGADHIEIESIQIIVSDRWITVSGNVADPAQSDAIEQAFRCMRDVRGVTNEIDIRSGTECDHVRRRVQAVLARQDVIDPAKIRVAVHGSEVTLEGEVGTASERSAAEFAAWNMTGVQHVIDKLTIQALSKKVAG